MLGAMCQYDPECSIHRHRPGTTCPVMYRKRMAALREEERREEQLRERRETLIMSAVSIVILVAAFVLINQIFDGIFTNMISDIARSLKAVHA